MSRVEKGGSLYSNKIHTYTHTIMKTLNFEKFYDADRNANTYVFELENIKFELYQERTYKSNGTSKCDGDWLVQFNGKIVKSYSTLNQAKKFVEFCLVK